MIKYYQGNYTLKFGHPMVIISAIERDKDFYAEKFILFEYSKGIKLVPTKVTHPKIENQTLKEFIESELAVTKDDIYHKIILIEFEEKFPNEVYNFQINLSETDQSILSILKEKNSDKLKEIMSKTSNHELKQIIQIYLSFRIHREEF